ncbi:unnamed protein product [Clonostachys solani]|uniref:Uncharacterized protein n=1 Tax=Clonostachys solani TaxID=160281 RepID=A0A9P0ETR3_9HYPO|nr:unnamed protein product [Clonostachys solani]
MENHQQRKAGTSRMSEKLEQRYQVLYEYLDLLGRREHLRLEIEPRFRPDQLQPVIDDRAKLAELARLGVEMAEKNKEAAGLEREVAIEEIKVWSLSRDFAERKMRLVSGGVLAAGEELWKYERERVGERYDDFPMRTYEFHDCMQDLYQQPGARDQEAAVLGTGGQDVVVLLSTSWSTDIDGAPLVQCQISGEFFPKDDVEIAPIVPYFVDSGAFAPLLFGSGAESLRGSGNFLVLHREIIKWFGTYKLVILPYDRDETPIRRWKAAVISSRLNSERFAGRSTLVSAFHSQELAFNNEQRPVARFAYFHFVMALVRAKMLNCEGWRDAWAKYYLNPPFPQQSQYMRECMLFGLFTYFDCGSIDLGIIDSWIRGNGFYEHETLYGRERDELARRILAGVDEAVVTAETQARIAASPDDSETESDSSEDDSEAEFDSSEDDSEAESDSSEDDSEAESYGSEDDSEAESGSSEDGSAED